MIVKIAYVLSYLRYKKITNSKIIVFVFYEKEICGNL